MRSLRAALVALVVLTLLVMVPTAVALVAPSGEGTVAATAPDHGPAVVPLSPGPSVGNGSWPTYMYDIERTGANPDERTIGVTNVATLQPVWSVASNGSDFSAPIVVNGTVYYGSWNGDEYAVNATTGAVLWQTFLGTDDCGGYAPMGVSSTPAYANGTLYLGGGHGYWYALNASTGAVDWSILPGSVADNYYAWASALLYGSHLYIGTSSCFDNPLVPASLMEVSLAGSHNVTAQFNTTPPGQIGESIWTTPAVDPATNTVWVSTGNENPPAYPPYANAIIGLNATTLQPLGSWQVPNVEGQDSDFGSTPTLFHTPTGVPMIVATNKNGVAYALNRSNVSVNGSWGPAWSLSTGGGFSGGAYDGSTLYLGGDSVYAVYPSNGTPKWTAPMVGGGYITGSLSWANGLVYAGGGSEVEAIDAANGTVLWSAALPPGQSTVTEPVVEGGRLFVASGDYGSHGQLTAYALQPWAVEFTASGVPPGRSWGVSLGGLSKSSANGSITFYEPNGSYPYLLRGPSGTVVSGPPPSGNVTVAGANVTLAVGFAAGRTSSVTFREGGLSAHTPWCASLGGWTDCPVRATVTLRNLTPASYPYAVGAVAGYSASVRVDGAPAPRTGTVDLSAHGGTVAVTYTRSVVPVTFEEAGLAAGAHWSVRLVELVAGHRRSSTQGTAGSSLQFSEPNGTFDYTARAGPDFVALSGSVTVNGSALVVNLTFVRMTATVTFVESGLAAGTGWAVSLNGSVPGWTNATASGNATMVVFAVVPDGTYVDHVASVPGYTASAPGTVTVTGTHASVRVRFHRT